MIRKLTSAALLTLLAASTACFQGQDAGLLLGNIRGFDTEDQCAPRGDDDFRVPSGFVNLAGTTRYVNWVEVISQLDVFERETGDDTVEVPNANDAVAERVNLSYRVEGEGGPTLEEESYPIHFVVPPASAGSPSLLGVDFFGPAAQRALAEVAPGADFTVYVTVTLSGRLRSGARFESANIVYPISVIRSAACAAGTAPGFTGPCGGPGGQDNFPLVCCPVENPLCASEDTQ